MARYVTLTNCPNCGSSDAKAEYDDGSSYCFSCRAYHKPNYFLSKKREEKPNTFKRGLTTTNTLPIQAKQWLLKYGLTQTETSSYCWSDFYGLCFPLPRGGYVCRGFGKPWKYKVLGERHSPVFHFQGATVVIFVEDIVSAIKVGRHTTTIPLLGCVVQKDHLSLAKKYADTFYLWLDPNKRKDSIQQCLRLRGLGLNISPIFSEVDPKELSDIELKEKLQYI